MKREAFLAGTPLVLSALVAPVVIRKGKKRTELLVECQYCEKKERIELPMTPGGFIVAPGSFMCDCQVWWAHASAAKEK